VQAQRSGAKVLGIANAGNDTSNTIKQAAEFGIPRRMQVVGLVMVITNIHSLGLEAAQGLYLTETFYWDLNDRTRALSARLAPKVGGARMTMLQAGSYGGALHWLKAVASLDPAARASGRAVVDRMKAMPTDDDAFGSGSIRADGRKLHPAYLLQVKAPADSSGPWDYCRVVATVPGEQAFRPLADGNCPLVR
jgi:branched-chain amino acid transport system substrate-binding protein